MPKFSPSVLRQYCYDVMTASGVDSVCAEATAEMLVDAEVTGMSTHGVSRLSIYMERIQAGDHVSRTITSAIAAGGSLRPDGGCRQLAGRGGG